MLFMTLTRRVKHRDVFHIPPLNRTHYIKQSPSPGWLFYWWWWEDDKFDEIKFEHVPGFWAYGPEGGRQDAWNKTRQKHWVLRTHL